MIAVDPHKGSHTAVAVSATEEPLGQLRVRACPGQAEQRINPERRKRAHIHQLEALGYKVTLEPAA
jgi:hypothetical protein